MLPVEHNDPINAKILAISEDKIEGFFCEPFEEIANRSGVSVENVMARIAAMLRAGTIRRVRQTLLATNLAEGALVRAGAGARKRDRVAGRSGESAHQRDGRDLTRDSDAAPIPDQPSATAGLSPTLRLPPRSSEQPSG